MRPDRDAAPPRHRRSYAYVIAIIILGLFAGLALTETWVRMAKWRPPVQMIRGYNLHSLDGVPVWEVASDRQNRTCVEQHPERIRILFFGSSITFGSDLTANETFTTALEAQLNAARPSPGFCVLNFAQSGFSFEQKYAIARVEVARYKPALIMWEDWTEWMGYSLIGETAYGTSGFVIRPDGFIGIAGVPDSLNRALLLHSRLYEYLTLSFGERFNRIPAEEAKAFVRDRLVLVPRLAQSVGAKLVLYLAPPLDRSFPETSSSLPDWHQLIIDFGRTHGIPVYPLQRELIDQDYLKIRQDPCCHYNAEGHRALVSVMQRIILQQLDGKPAEA